MPRTLARAPGRARTLSGGSDSCIDRSSKPIPKILRGARRVIQRAEQEPAPQPRIRRGYRRSRSASGPDPVDLHVGRRIRQRRKIVRMSQSELAAQLDMSFQNVQKYERGATRISASVLWHAARILDVPVGYFFDGADITFPAPPPHDRKLEEALIHIARLYAQVPIGIRVAITGLIERVAASADRASGEKGSMSPPAATAKGR